MLQIHANWFYWMVTLLEQTKNIYRLQNAESVIDEENRLDLLRRLNLAKDYSVQLSLPVTGKLIERLINQAQQQGCKFGEFVSEFNELLHRFTDELEDRLLFHIPSEHQKYFTESQKLMGDEVIAKFPSAIFDIEEAGKCLAITRETACVFHLMRIMEAGLRYLCVEAASFGISIPDPDSNRSWSGWLDPIEKELRKDRKLKTAEWNAIEPAYAQVAAHLRTVSTAWRNPTMHVGTKYTPEEAEDIFNATRGFMRHLSTAKLRK